MWSLKLANVDPFVVTWPRKWLSDPELRPQLEYLNRFLHDIFLRTGGGVDKIENNTVNIGTNTDESKLFNIYSQENEQEQRFSYPEYVEPKAFRAITTSIDYTCVGYEFVNAKSGAQITFNEYPEENEVVIVRNGDGTSIKLNGNGKNINGSSLGNIRTKGTAINFHYFIDSDEWFAR